MFCHVTLKFKEINNFKARVLASKRQEICEKSKKLDKFVKSYGVVQVSQTTGYESVLFWTSCKCLWTLYGAKTSKCKSQNLQKIRKNKKWQEANKIIKTWPRSPNDKVEHDLKNSIFYSVWFKVIFNGFKTVIIIQT